jgi:REP element-mobilizing transposase RayT
MPRPLRIQEPGGIVHVTARGNRRQRIFRVDHDREVFLAHLGAVVKRTGWRCLAYCLMDTHYHLALETPDANLAEGMQRLNGIYAQGFNRRHRVSGHLFQGRYHSVPQRRDSQLLELFRYIALNPVRAGLCARPEEWRWGSHNALRGRAAAGFVSVDRALDYFGAWATDGRRGYEAFVAGGLLTPAR